MALVRVAILLFATACVLALPVRVAQAATHTYVINPSSGTVRCDKAGDEYVVSGTGSGGAVAIKGGSEGSPVYVTLDGLTVENGSGGHSNAPVQVEGGYCIIRLRGENRLVGGWHDITLKKDEGIAGLRVCSGATCVITSADGDGSTSGKLYAACAHDDRGGAGIGSNYDETTGTIIIRGGTIEAHGGHCGAGIGGGRDGICTNVTIEGGDITAYGGEYAAGIGGGDYVATGDGGTTQYIAIHGGTVHAYGGDNGGAGIGGSEGGTVGTILITGGDIYARGCGRDGDKGSGCAAGIGGGDGKAADSIKIDQAEGKDLTIDAKGAWATGITDGLFDGTGGAGIGSANATAGSISISLRGGTITAEGGEKAAGIGGGNKQSGIISIAGYGTITAKAGRNACAIGAGSQCHSKDITIRGSGPSTGTYGYPLVIRAKAGSTRHGGQDGALIGSGDGTAGNITIDKAYVTLEPPMSSSLSGAGIGTGHSNDLSLSDGGIEAIAISNSRILFSGGTSLMYGAGIGAGEGSNISRISLNNVVYDGPTIGSSCSTRATTDENDMDSITITGSTVTAEANDNQDEPWAGIGTGPDGGIGSISIVDSDVTAKGVHGAAGIGTAGLAFSSSFPLKMILSGKGKCGNVSIISNTRTPHTVTATGSGGGAGIGGGAFTSVEGSIVIRGATVVARAGSDTSGGGAGIGGGAMCNSGNITIDAANVTATGGDGSAGIGSGGFANSDWVSDLVATGFNTICQNVTIQGGSVVTATGGTGAAGIGLGEGAQQQNGTYLRIDGSTVSATGGDNGAGIGAGAEGGLGRGAEAHRISITGKARVEAHGGAGAAGIGGGYEGGLETCTIALTDYYDASNGYGSKEPTAYVRAYGGYGAAGIGAGASSRHSSTKGTLDGAHDAKDIRISGGFVAAYGGCATDKDEGGSGPGAGIGGGSHQGDLEGCVISGGVVVARAGDKHSGLTGAVAAEDIGHGGDREDDGGDGSDSISITDGTIIAGINQNEDVRISGGSVRHEFDLGKAKNSSSQGGQTVYQTSFKVDTLVGLPSVTFEGHTFYKLDDMTTSDPLYGCNHIFAHDVGDGRAQVWLYLPEGTTNSSTADFRIHSNATSVTNMRYYYGTTEQRKTPDFSAYKNVLKMGAPIELEPDASTPTPFAGKKFKLNVTDVSHSLAGKEVSFVIQNGTLLNGLGETQPILGATPAYVTVIPAEANQNLVVTATVGENNNPAPDLYWDSEDTYSAMVTQEPLYINIKKKLTKTYDGLPAALEYEDVDTNASSENVKFAYYVAESSQSASANELGYVPTDPGAYYVVATATQGTDAVAATQDFTINKYHAVIRHVNVRDYAYDETVVGPNCEVGAKETSTPAKSFEDANGTYSYQYAHRTSNGWQTVDGTPSGSTTGPGTYRVKVKANENAYYFASSEAPAYFSISEAPTRLDPYLFADMPAELTYNNAQVDDPLVWTSSDGTVSYTYYEGNDPATGTRLQEKPKNAGTYCVVVSVPETEKYNAVSQTCVFTILPRPVALSVEAVPGQNESATVTVRLAGALADAIDKSVQLKVSKDGEVQSMLDSQLTEDTTSSDLIASCSFADVENATYVLDASFSLANYVPANASQEYIKDKSAYNVNVDDVEKTYGDGPFGMTVTVTADDGNSIDTSRLSYAVVSPSPDNAVVSVDNSGIVSIINAGTAIVRVTMPSDESHREGSACATITVAKAPVTLDLNVEESKTYDGQPVQVECAVAPEEVGESASLTYYQKNSLGAWKGLANVPTDPGEYAVVGRVTASRNFEAATKQATFSIKPYDTSLEVFAVSKEFDDRPAEVWHSVGAADVSEPLKAFGDNGGVVAYKYERLEDGRWAEVCEEPVDVGSYRVTARAFGDMYYTDAVATASFEITADPIVKAPTHIDLVVSDKVYDGKPVEVTATVLDESDARVGALTATIRYYQLQDGSFERLEEAPSAVGSYCAYAWTEGNNEYESSRAWTSFEIYESAPQPQDPELTARMPETHVYDMCMVDDPEVITDSDGEVEVAYYRRDGQGDELTPLASRPVVVGSYRAVVSVSATKRFNAVTTTCDFEIVPRPAVLHLMAWSTIDAGKEGATVLVTLSGGLQDLEGKTARLVISHDGAQPTTHDVELFSAGDVLAGRLTFSEVGSGEYVLTASMENPNYAIEGVSRTFDKDKSSYLVDAADKRVVFGSPAFALKVNVTTNDKQPVVNPDLEYAMVPSSRMPEKIKDDVAAVDAGGTVTPLNAGLAVVRVDAVGDDTHAGGEGFSVVVVERAPLPLSVYARNKTYDGKPAKVSCRVADGAFPTPYSEKDSIELDYYRVTTLEASGSGETGGSPALAAQSEWLTTSATKEKGGKEKLVPLDGAPTAPGTYVVEASASSDRNYEAATAKTRFVISPSSDPDDPDAPVDPKDPDNPANPTNPDDPSKPSVPTNPSSNRPSQESGGTGTTNATVTTGGTTSATSSSSAGKKTPVPTTGDASTQIADALAYVGVVACAVGVAWKRCFCRESTSA